MLNIQGEEDEGKYIIVQLMADGQGLAIGEKFDTLVEARDWIERTALDQQRIRFVITRIIDYKEI